MLILIFNLKIFKRTSSPESVTICTTANTMENDIQVECEDSQISLRNHKRRKVVICKSPICDSSGNFENIGLITKKRN